MDDFDIYLASTSPRRRELLEQIGIRYRLIKIDIPEIPLDDETPIEFVERMAIEKAQAGKGYRNSHGDKPVLGADTAVVVNNEILGKPRDKAHALEMLAILSGRSHEVISAVALVDDGIRTRVNISTVSFRRISKTECEKYWQTGEPNGKAGAYGIQGIAAIFVSGLEGSYSAVMGLPLYETAELLAEAGIRPLR